MKFEKDKFYKRRDGQKALCVHVWTDGTAAFVLTDNPMCAWGVGMAGNADLKEFLVCDSDILSEWREPHKWTLWLVERKGNVHIRFQDPGSWGNVLAVAEVTEGDGL